MKLVHEFHFNERLSFFLQNVHNNFEIQDLATYFKPDARTKSTVQTAYIKK